MEIFLSVISACSQGLIWAIMAIGLYITYKILDYADLTVDGSLALGGSVSAVVLCSGFDPFLSLIIALFSGAIAGICTGLFHTKLRIPAILSGILTMISLYSVNIRIMGKANTSLIGKKTVFSYLDNIMSSFDTGIIAEIGSLNIAVLVNGFLICAALVGGAYWFFGTEIGSAIRATGNNDYMARALGINTDKMKIIGLALSNGLVALSGALLAQSQGYADVGMGTGTMVVGFASVIIGEVLFRNSGRFAFAFRLLSVVAGSVVYRVIISGVIMLGLNSSDLKLFTAIIVALALFLPKIRARGGINARA